MTFNVLSQPPEESQMVNPVLANIEEVLAVHGTVPLPDMLYKEATYWSPEREDVHAERMAEVMRRRLRDVVYSSQDIYEHLQESKDSNYRWDPEDSFFTQRFAASWFGTAIIATSLSRLWQELPGGVERYGEVIKTARESVSMDFDFQDGERSGIHFKPDQLREFIGLEPAPSDRMTWLEGDSLYLRVSSPADPTAYNRGHYGDKYVDGYTSVVPRLKVNSEWQ